jgi:hypothetical protein
VFILALVLDVIYQIIAEHFVTRGSGHRRVPSRDRANADSAWARHAFDYKEMMLAAGQAIWTLSSSATLNAP